MTNLSELSVDLGRKEGTSYQTPPEPQGDVVGPAEGRRGGHAWVWSRRLRKSAGPGLPEEAGCGRSGGGAVRDGVGSSRGDGMWDGV